MKLLRSVTFAAALLTATSIGAAAENSAQSPPDKELEAMLEKYSEASEMFYNGKPEAVKALWSHSDDVTLSGAAGGPTRKDGTMSAQDLIGPALNLKARKARDPSRQYKRLSAEASLTSCDTNIFAIAALGSKSSDGITGPLLSFGANRWVGVSSIDMPTPLWQSRAFNRHAVPNNSFKPKPLRGSA